MIHKFRSQKSLDHIFSQRSKHDTFAGVVVGKWRRPYHLVDSRGNQRFPLTLSPQTRNCTWKYSKDKRTDYINVMKQIVKNFFLFEFFQNIYSWTK
jgi:hypothetical protein